MYEIRMKHPSRNALGSDLMKWLHDEVTTAGEEPILLTGTGDSFCAGLDLKELAGLQPKEMPAFLAMIDDLAERLFDHPAPTVAFVNGHAIAGGCVLAVCCDYRIAERSPRTRIGLNEVALGACFPPRVFSIMRHRIGAAHRHEVLLGAGLYDVDESVRLGLLDEVCEDAEVEARNWLERLSAHPRETYRITKELLQAGVTEITAEEDQRFAEESLPIWTSEELKQRVLGVLGG